MPTVDVQNHRLNHTLKMLCVLLFPSWPWMNYLRKRWNRPWKFKTVAEENVNLWIYYYCKNLDHQSWFRCCQRTTAERHAAQRKRAWQLRIKCESRQASRSLPLPKEAEKDRLHGVGIASNGIVIVDWQTLIKRVVRFSRRLDRRVKSCLFC